MVEDPCIKYIEKELISANYNLNNAYARGDDSAAERLRSKIEILTEIEKRLGGAYD